MWSKSVPKVNSITEDVGGGQKRRGGKRKNSAPQKCEGLSPACLSVHVAIKNSVQ